MKGRRHRPEQVVRKLREADKLLGEGFELADVLKELGVGGDVSPLAGVVRGDEGRRCEAVEGAGGGDCPAEADRGRSAVGYRGAQGAGEGKLLSPARRRRAVLAVRDRLGMSERRACRLTGQHRLTQRYEPVVAEDGAAVRARLREISRERPRWGYRCAHRLLFDDGWQLNIKRTRRLWREEGLGVPQKPQAPASR